MSSKRPVLRFTVTLFSSLSYFRPIFVVCVRLQNVWQLMYEALSVMFD